MNPKKIHRMAVGADGRTIVRYCDDQPSPFTSPLEEAVTCRKCQQAWAQEQHDQEEAEAANDEAIRRAEEASEAMALEEAYS